GPPHESTALQFSAPVCVFSGGGRDMMKNSVKAFVILNAVGLVAEGRVTRIQIASREPFANSMAFGAAGAYEKICGTAFFEVDPGDARNKVVFDLDKAAQNARGMVEFSADVYILKPLDMSKGNGAVLAEVPNRGNKWLLGYFN